MAIREWPRLERPREKLIERGAEALSDAELVAVLLGSGVRGSSAVELARGLIARFGSIRELLRAERKECLSQLGVGPARYARWRAALELARRHHLDALRIGPAIGSAQATRTFLIAQLRGVHPREVLRQVMAHNSAALILAHNHPLCCVAGVTTEPRVTRRETHTVLCAGQR